MADKQICWNCKEYDPTACVCHVWGGCKEINYTCSHYHGIDGTFKVYNPDKLRHKKKFMKYHCQDEHECSVCIHSEKFDEEEPCNVCLNADHEYCYFMNREEDKDGAE